MSIESPHEDTPSDRLPPRDVLVRAMRPGLEMRASETGGMPTMIGHFAVFNRWTEIDSMWEGQFMERIAPGAFARTFKNNRDSIRVTLNHGQDPTFGDKPLGPILELSEDKTGAYYEVGLLDTSYNRDLIPGLEAGLYGASFRFRVLKEAFDQKPGRSADNPDGLPQRTIQEAQVMEFGPVTFPAYTDATAGVRSLADTYTDTYIVQRLAAYPDRLQRLLQEHVPSVFLAVVPPVIPTALPPGPEVTHSEVGTRESVVAAPAVTAPVVPVPVVVKRRFQTSEDFSQWLTSKT